MKQQNLQVGAYTRLSRNDDTLGESGSIVIQKEIIRQYSERNGMTVKTYYQDDGFNLWRAHTVYSGAAEPQFRRFGNRQSGTGNRC